MSKLLNYIPKVLMDIGRGVISEDINSPEYYGFLGKESDIPGNHIGHGVFETPEGHYVFHNGSRSVKFMQQENAMDFAEAKRRKFKRDLSEIHDTLSTKAKELSPEEKQTVNDYTDRLNRFSNNGVKLNEHLHHGLGLNDKQKDFVSRFDNVLGNNSTHDAMTVFTGTNKKHADILRNNDVVDHKGYLSTSISQNSARAFAQDNGGDIVKIHIPKGHAGLYVSHHSAYEGEREFVLPRNTRLRIHRDKEQVLIHDSGKYIVHHATIEPKDKNESL